MTGEERAHADDLAEALACEHRAHTEFVRAITVTIGAIPIIYGLLTFIYRNALWNPNGVHENLLRLPGAPQSWGAILIGLGVGVLASAALGRRRALVCTALSAGLVFSTFMVVVLTSPAFPRTLGQATIYGGIAVLFMHRARLAWVL